MIYKPIVVVEESFTNLECLEEILSQINDEEEKVKYSEMIINNWTNHYEGNKERLDKIKELLSYNDENEELEENDEKISENNEYNEYNNNNEINKNKVTSLMEKALATLTSHEWLF